MWRQTFILPLPRYYPSILLIATADHATWNTWWVWQSTTLVTAYYCTNMLTFWHLNASFLSSCNQHGIVWMLSAKLTNLQSATRSACLPLCIFWRHALPRSVILAYSNDVSIVSPEHPTHVVQMVCPPNVHTPLRTWCIIWTYVRQIIVQCETILLVYHQCFTLWCMTTAYWINSYQHRWIPGPFPVAPANKQDSQRC